MVKEAIKQLPKNIWIVVSGSTARAYRKGEQIVEKYHRARDRIPVYEIQPDGTIKRFWEHPDNREDRAYDLEHNHKNQVFAKGYANPLDVKVENIKNGEFKFIPSQKYQTYMKQKVISDSMTAGSDTLTQVKYLTMANLVMIVIAVLIGVSMAT